MPNWMHDQLNSKFAFNVRKLIPVWIMRQICRYRVSVIYSKDQYPQMYDWVKSEMTYFDNHTIINRVIERNFSSATNNHYDVRVTSIEFFFRSKSDAAMFKLQFSDLLEEAN